MGGPWIFYLEVTKPEQQQDMGDIEFLSIKEFDGKLRSDEGSLSATGDLATLTATLGKDMYIARAKVVFFAITSSSFNSLADEVVLKLNGTVIETSKESQGVESISLRASNTVEYEFKNIGKKVAAGETIKLEVITLSASVDVEGFIECFEEDTGTTPQISPL